MEEDEDGKKEADTEADADGSIRQLRSCRALRIMLDGEVLYARGLFYQDFLNACINRSRFSRKASSTVK